VLHEATRWRHLVNTMCGGDGSVLNYFDHLFMFLLTCTGRMHCRSYVINGSKYVLMQDRSFLGLD